MRRWRPKMAKCPSVTLCNVEDVVTFDFSIRVDLPPNPSPQGTPTVSSVTRDAGVLTCAPDRDWVFLEGDCP